jgi:hypothetical protein
MGETPSPWTKVDKRNLLPLGLIIVFGIFCLDIASASGAGNSAAAIPPQE